MISRWSPIGENLILSYYTTPADIYASLERIQGYLDIEHEPKATQKGKPPAAWPTSGKLRVEKLSARYSPVGQSPQKRVRNADDIFVLGWPKGIA